MLCAGFRPRGVICRDDRSTALSRPLRLRDVPARDVSVAGQPDRSRPHRCRRVQPFQAFGPCTRRCAEALSASDAADESALGHLGRQGDVYLVVGLVGRFDVMALPPNPDVRRVRAVSTAGGWHCADAADGRWDSGTAPAPTAPTAPGDSGLHPRGGRSLIGCGRFLTANRLRGGCEPPSSWSSRERGLPQADPLRDEIGLAVKGLGSSRPVSP